MKVLFTALVMLCLVLDAGAPTLPGAVTFDPEDSVEVVRHQRTPSPLPRTPAVMPEPLLRLPPVRSSFHVRRVVSHRSTPAPIRAVRHLPPDASASDEG
jgi:hypothetical protein